MTFAGSCNRDLVERGLEECLVPQLRAGDVIVIDNASFHHSQTIEEIVAQAGCEIWYLPPYSPDLNEIEHWWFVLKNWMRQRWDEFDIAFFILARHSNSNGRTNSVGHSMTLGRRTPQWLCLDQDSSVPQGSAEYS